MTVTLPAIDMQLWIAVVLLAAWSWFWAWKYRSHDRRDAGKIIAGCGKIMASLLESYNRGEQAYIATEKDIEEAVEARERIEQTNSSYAERPFTADDQHEYDLERGAIR